MRRSQCRLARERLGEVAPQFCDRRGGLRGLELGARGPERVPPRDRRGRGERRVAAGAAERRRERVVFALPERGLAGLDVGGARVDRGLKLRERGVRVGRRRLGRERRRLRPLFILPRTQAL